MRKRFDNEGVKSQISSIKHTKGIIGMSLNKRLVFLFGSGISLPAEFPSMKELTQTVLRAEEIVRATDGTYYLSGNKEEYFLASEYVSRLKFFLEKIKVEVDSYYSEDSHETNYEDLYYVVSQIRDSELREYDNPAIKPLIDKIFPEIKTLFSRRENDTHADWTLLDLANESANYIRDVIWRSLLATPKHLDHLQLIRDACLNEGLDYIDICTLNHDTLLEQYLFDNDIEVNDGFGTPINDFYG